MERRRNRRGRCAVYQPPPPARSSIFFSFLQTLLIMGSIAAILYMMMDYHCRTCNSTCEIKKLSKNIDQLAICFNNILEIGVNYLKRTRAGAILQENLTRIHGFYVELEMKVRQFSQDLPKIEGQVEILESIAKSLVSRRNEWNPKSHLTLPDVHLKPPVHKCHSLPNKNCTKIPLPCRKASQVR